MNFIHSTHPEEQDWHTYTLHGRSSHQLSPQGHQYESLTGLLLQENTPSSFNDDDSYKHHPAFVLEEEMNARRERDEKRRARRILRRCFSKIRRRCHRRYDSPLIVVGGLCGIGAIGTLLGVIMPQDRGETTNSLPWDTVSNMIGYTYFLSWTLSFYPQIITNCKQPQDAKRGVSIEFLVWNMIGFACYVVYVTSLMYSDVVRKEYADRFVGGGANVSGSELSKLIHNHMVSASFDNGLAGVASFQFLYNNTATEMNESVGFDNSTDRGAYPQNNDTFGNNSTATNADNADQPMAEPQVKFNDVAFAWHALILSIITYVQIVCFSKDKPDEVDQGENISGIECSVRQQQPVNGGWSNPQRDDEILAADLNCIGVSPTEGSILFKEHQQINLRKQMQSQGIYQQLDSLVESDSHNCKQQSRISYTSKCSMIILLIFCIAGVLLVLVWSQWQWIDYLYFLSFVKVCISIVKYIPQAVLNYRRKSTSGWQIWNILLDFSGGSLSVIQLVGDSLAEARTQGLQTCWRGILGNPSKLGLGLVSILFDVIFLVQHYFLYPHSKSNNGRAQLDFQSTQSSTNEYAAPLLPDSDAEVIVFV